MKYLLMCCFDEDLWAKLPDSQRRRIMDEYGKLIHALNKNGRLLAGAKLDQCATAVTVRDKNGKVAVMDGPSRKPKSNSAAIT
ncbi:MAG: YciI family protein [Gammaproteobacteria bacterium]